MVAIVSSPVQDIRVADIHESPLNPRKHFDQKKLAELASNLRDVGQIEAITVRPSASRPGKFELVNGARRWRAAQVANLETLAAKVRDMSDGEALAIMLITGSEGNVEALTPLEEAAGYHDAMRIMALSLEGIATRFGKSVTYIHQRLALLQLPADARAALEKGELAPRTAFEIARIPGDDKRVEAAKAILHSEVHGGVMPSRAAKLFIEKQICRTLHGAPFDTADASLVPAAGSCAVCPYRAGNNPETYGDVKNPHTCMNPGCYEGKVSAARTRVLAREAKDGKEALSPEVNAELFPPDEKGLSWKSSYVAFTQPIPRDLLKPEVTKAPTWASLVESGSVKIYVGIDQAGVAIDVARIGEVLAAVPASESAIFGDDVARRHGLARSPGSVRGKPERSFAEQEKVEQDLREKADRAAKKRIKKARAWLDDLVTGLEGMAAAGKPAWSTYEFWSLMFERMLAALGDDDVAFVCEVFGISEEIVVSEDATARQVLTEFVARISKDRCGALVTAMTLAPWLRAEGPDAKFVTEWHQHFVAGPDHSSAKSENRDGEPEPSRQREGMSVKPAPAIAPDESAKLGQLVKAYDGGSGMSPQRCSAEFGMSLEDVCGALQLDHRAVRNVVTQLRQDVEEGFAAAKIMTPTLRNRVVKTATSNRVKEFAALAWPEDLRRVLTMLSQKTQQTAPAAAAEQKEDDK